MKKRVEGIILKNAAANIVRGGATAAAAVLLPHFLTKALDPTRFAAWSLALQIAAYASYLDFGLQTAVARFVSQATEMQEWERRDQLIGTALSLLTGAAGLAILVLGVVILNIPQIFHGVPGDLVSELKISTGIVAVCSCLVLPLSTYTGVLVGLHRNEFPALAIGGSRLVGAAAVIIASHYTHSLIILASCIGIGNISGGIVQWIMVKRMIPEYSYRISLVVKSTARELAHYCSSLTVFSAGMFLVTGLDVTIVGHFRFQEAGPYAVASLLIAFFAGLNQSVMAAFVAPVAALQASRRIDEIRQLVMRTMKLIVFFSCIFATFILLLGHVMLRLEAGLVYADQAAGILYILGIAQAIRVTGAPFCNMLVATGQQKKAIHNVMGEAITNLVFSLILGKLYGGIGVAIGTLIGAVMGILIVYLHTVPRANEVPIRASRLLRESVMPSILCSIPLGCSLLAPHPNTATSVLLMLAAASISAMLAWRFNILPRRLPFRTPARA